MFVPNTPPLNLLANFYHLFSQRVQFDLIFCDLLQRQNSVAETKIFPKMLQYTRSNIMCRYDVWPHRVAATSRPTCSHGVICHRDVLLQLVAWCVP